MSIFEFYSTLFEFTRVAGYFDLARANYDERGGARYGSAYVLLEYFFLERVAGFHLERNER